MSDAGPFGDPLLESREGGDSKRRALTDRREWPANRENPAAQPQAVQGTPTLIHRIEAAATDVRIFPTAVRHALTTIGPCTSSPAGVRRGMSTIWPAASSPIARTVMVSPSIVTSRK